MAPGMTGVDTMGPSLMGPIGAMDESLAPPSDEHSLLGDTALDMLAFGSRDAPFPSGANGSPVAADSPRGGRSRGRKRKGASADTSPAGSAGFGIFAGVAQLKEKESKGKGKGRNGKGAEKSPPTPASEPESQQKRQKKSNGDSSSKPKSQSHGAPRAAQASAHRKKGTPGDRG